MDCRGMRVADAHCLKKIRDFAKYRNGPSAECFADWSGRYHLPALVGKISTTSCFTAARCGGGKGDQDEMFGMSAPAPLSQVSHRRRRRPYQHAPALPF